MSRGVHLMAWNKKRKTRSDGAGNGTHSTFLFLQKKKKLNHGVCVCMYTHACVYVWKSEEELVLSTRCVVPQDQTQVVRLGSKHLIQSHLSIPYNVFLSCIINDLKFSILTPPLKCSLTFP